jgi:hypothetical protein
MLLDKKATFTQSTYKISNIVGSKRSNFGYFTKVLWLLFQIQKKYSILKFKCVKLVVLTDDDTKQ